MTEETGRKKFSYVCAAAAGLALLGVLLWWPLGILAIVLATLGRHFLCALLIGVVLDVLWGVPPSGFFGSLVIPCTLFALVAICARIVAGKFLRTQ